MRFYRLKSPKPDSAEDRAGRIDAMKPEQGVNRGPAPVCPRCGKFIGMRTWLPPFQLELETWGERYGDIVDVGGDLVVSYRFRVAFKEAGLIGLEGFEPVEIVKVTHRRGKPQGTMPDYFKTTVIRSPATVDQEASGVVWKDAATVCPECLIGDVFKRQERLVIRPETWNGEDVFFPRGGNGPIVSERFRTLFHDQSFVGAVFIPAEEDQVDYYPWETAANES